MNHPRALYIPMAWFSVQYKIMKTGLLKITENSS